MLVHLGSDDVGLGIGGGHALVFCLLVPLTGLEHDVPFLVWLVKRLVWKFIIEFHRNVFDLNLPVFDARRHRLALEVQHHFV